MFEGEKEGTQFMVSLYQEIASLYQEKKMFIFM